MLPMRSIWSQMETHFDHIFENMILSMMKETWRDTMSMSYFVLGVCRTPTFSSLFHVFMSTAYSVNRHDHLKGGGGKKNPNNVSV